MGFEDAGRYWHSDISYDEVPAMGSHLYAVEIPSEGGDTLFADMRHALRTLPAELRRRIDGRRARHSYTRNWRRNETVEGGRPAISAEQRDRLREVSHPMVRRVGDAGEEALFVNPGFTFAVEDMDEAESDGLLAALFEHSTREAFISHPPMAAPRPGVLGQSHGDASGDDLRSGADAAHASHDGRRQPSGLTGGGPGPRTAERRR